MHRIKIQAVLAQINQVVDDDKPYYFSIRYVKKDGTVGFKERVRKSGSIHKGEQKGTSAFRYNVREKGVLMLQQEGADKPFAIKISLITHFNGVQIFH